MNYQHLFNPSSNSNSPLWRDMYEDNREYWRADIGEEPGRNWDWEVP